MNKEIPNRCKSNSLKNQGSKQQAWLNVLTKKRSVLSAHPLFAIYAHAKKMKWNSYDYSTHCMDDSNWKTGRSRNSYVLREAIHLENSQR